MSNSGALAPPLQIVDEDRVAPSLDAAIRRLLCTCFPADAEAFAARRAWNGVSPVFSVLARDGDDVAGHVGIIERQITCRGAAVRVAGIQSLAVTPQLRGSGLSQRLLNAAMQEARRRGFPFGLLFCVPVLEKLYAALGWQRIERAVDMRDSAGRTVPLTAKNICMELPLAENTLPPGAIDLCGRDW